MIFCFIDLVCGFYCIILIGFNVVFVCLMCFYVFVFLWGVLYGFCLGFFFYIIYVGKFFEIVDEYFLNV